MNKKHKDHHQQPQEQPDAPSPTQDPTAAEQPKQAAPAQPAGKTPLEQERDDLLARLQRVSADYLNYQKRASRDVDNARQFANEELLKALLPVFDDMERAIAAAKENHPPEDPLLIGTQLVHDKAVDILRRFGISVIDDTGGRFDPERHSAILQQPSTEYPPMTVLQVAQKGYSLKGRTIRPASVIVSKAPETGAEGTGEAEAQP